MAVWVERQAMPFAKNGWCAEKKWKIYAIKRIKSDEQRIRFVRIFSFYVCCLYIVFSFLFRHFSLLFLAHSILPCFVCSAIRLGLVLVVLSYREQFKKKILFGLSLPSRYMRALIKVGTFSFSLSCFCFERRIKKQQIRLPIAKLSVHIKTAHATGFFHPIFIHFFFAVFMLAC